MPPLTIEDSASSPFAPAALAADITAVLCDRVTGGGHAVALRLVYATHHESAALLGALGNAGWAEATRSAALTGGHSTVTRVELTKPGSEPDGSWGAREACQFMRDLGDILVCHGVTDIREDGGTDDPAA